MTPPTQLPPLTLEYTSTLMVPTMNLTELLEHTGLDAADRLDRHHPLRPARGPRTLGGLLVLPLADTDAVEAGGKWRLLADPRGMPLFRGPLRHQVYTLHGTGETCRVGPVRDRSGLGLLVVRTTAVAHLLHPEHGALAIAPGTWLVRRRRDRGGVSAGRVLTVL